MSLNDTNDPISVDLAAAHSAVNERHERARANLLGLLSNEAAPTVQAAKSPFTKRFIFGVFGVSAAAAAVFIVVGLFPATPPVVAMDRLASALDQISGYSYCMEMTYVSRKDSGRTVRQVTVGSWRTSPAALRATMRIDETLGTSTAIPGVPKTIVDLEESHQVKGGIVIDHLKKEFWKVNDKLGADAIPPGSPQVAVHMVQQRRGRVLRDLGTASINGRAARGLEIMLDGGQPVSELGANQSVREASEGQEMDWRNTKFEVWIDSRTDLPIEFRCARSGEDFKTNYRFTDLNWNVDFGNGAFDLRPPEGYSERIVSTQ